MPVETPPPGFAALTRAKLAILGWSLSDERLMDLMFFAAVLVPWLICAWAMVMMLVTALKDRDDFTLGWLVGGSFIFEKYNRKYL